MPTIKKTSFNNKDTQLLSVFTSHFSNHLNFARIQLICLFIHALCKVKSVNLTKIAVGFDLFAKESSNYRRLQRFFQQVHLPSELIATLIFNLLPNKDRLVLVIDRTNWQFGGKDINILMLGVSYKNVAFPLLFSMLDKKGNSNTAERITLLQKFIKLFGKECIDCLLADREFVGEQWLNFLNNNRIRYYIRIRNNFQLYCPRRQRKINASHFFNNLKMGEIRHHYKIVKINNQYCYVSAIKTSNEKGVDFCIVISFNKPEESLSYYAQRWQIETLFRAFKSSGFNLEQTHLKHTERIEKLVLLVMIAFVWCYKIGDFIDKEIKQIPLKKHGRRAKSIFRAGLDYLSHWLLTNTNILEINLIKFLSCT
jgi:hypothetical protein